MDRSSTNAHTAAGGLRRRATYRYWVVPIWGRKYGQRYGHEWINAMPCTQKPMSITRKGGAVGETTRMAIDDRGTGKALGRPFWGEAKP